MTKWGVTSEVLEKYRDDMVAIMRIWNDYLVSMAPAYQSLIDWCAAFVEFAWTAYRAAGVPYGETEEGMWQWLKEGADR